MESWSGEFSRRPMCRSKGMSSGCDGFFRSISFGTRGRRLTLLDGRDTNARSPPRAAVVPLGLAESAKQLIQAGNKEDSV